MLIWVCSVCWCRNESLGTLSLSWCYLFGVESRQVRGKHNFIPTLYRHPTYSRTPLIFKHFSCTHVRSSASSVPRYSQHGLSVALCSTFALWVAPKCPDKLSVAEFTAVCHVHNYTFHLFITTFITWPLRWMLVLSSGLTALCISTVEVSFEASIVPESGTAGPVSLQGLWYICRRADRRANLPEIGPCCTHCST